MSDAGEGPGVEDLDVDAQEAAEVTGGRSPITLKTGDPCDGGE